MRSVQVLIPVVLVALSACGEPEASVLADTPAVVAQGLAPVNSLPAAQTTNEDTRLDFSSAAGNPISVTDADNVNTQVQITVTNGTFTIGGGAPGGVSISGNGTSVVIITGPVTGVSDCLDGGCGTTTTFYQPAANFTGAATLQMNSADTNGETDFDVMNITVTAFNDPPTNLVPAGTQSATEDIPRAFSLTVNDVDIGSAPLAVSLTANNGTVMTLPVTTGLSFTTGTGSGDAVMAFSGTLPNVNSALNGLTVTSPANFVGLSSIILTTNDGGASGAGIAGEDSNEILINWAAVNDPPVNTVPGGQTIAEEGSVVFAGQALAVDDIDGPTTLVQVTLSATGGTLSLGTPGAVSFTNGDGAGDAAMTFSGTLSALGTALANTVFTANANFAGTATVTMVSNDLGNSGTGGARQDTDSVTITVTGVNDAPVNSMPANQFATEDIVLALSNVNRITLTDVDAPTLQVTLTATNGTVTLPSRTGLVFQVGDGIADATTTFTGTVDAVNRGIDGLQFLGTPNFNGTASLTVLTSDLGGTGAGGTLTDTDAITLSIAAVNDPPNAINDALTINEDAGATNILVLTNDTIAPDVGETLAVTAVSTPANGVATFNAGQVTYTPNANFAGVDAFSYTISDGGLTDTANVTVNVTAVNDPPTAVNDAFTVAQDTPVTLGVLSNDSAAPDVGEALSVSAVTQPANGVVSINAGNSTIAFTPGAGFTGSDSFTYTLSDGALTAVATVGLTVTAVNTTPVNTLPGPQITTEDNPLFFSSVAGTAITVADANNATLTVQLVANNGTFTLGATTGLTVSGNGSALVTAQGTIAALNAGLNNGRYTPATNFSGASTLIVTTSDSNGESDVDTLTMTVTPVNDLPVNVVPSGNQAATEDTPRTFISISVTDVDIGGAEAIVALSANNGTLISLAGTSGLTFSSGDGSADGALTFAGTLTAINTALNGLTVTSPTDFIGNSTLSMTTDDQAGGVTTSNLNIVWGAVNDPPQHSVPAALAGTEETSVTLTVASGTAIRVADVDVSAGFAQVTLSAAGGSMTLGSTVGLTFTAGDGNADTAMTFSGTLANLNNALDGLVLTPSANFAGAGTITVVTNDLGNSGSGGARTDTDVVTINFGGVNDAPVNGVPGTQTVNEDVNRVFSTGNGNLITVADVDASAVQVSLSGTNGVVTLASTTGLSFQAGDGAQDETMTFTATVAAANAALANVTFRGSADFNGAAALTVLTSDLGGSGAGGVRTDTDTIVINVSPVNDPPNAANDAATFDEDPILAVSIPVLANDSFAPDLGETLAINAVSLPANGAAVISGTSVLYTPNANFNGTDSFTYDVRDGNGGIDTATVVLTVASINDPPTAVDDTFAVLQTSGANALNVLANDSAAPDLGETISVTAVGTPSHGTAVVAGVGTRVDYTPTPGYTGADSFTYTVSDGALTTTATVDISVVLVNVNPVNHLPTPQTTLEDAALFFNVAGANLITVSDDNSDTLTIQIVATNGTFQLVSTGALSSVSGNNTATVTATGTKVALNASLNGARFTPAANFNGATRLTITTSDTDGNSDSDALNLTVTSSNDAPINAAPTATQSATEDTPRTFGSISVSDLDIGGGQLLVQLTVDTGTLVTIGTAGLSFSAGDGTSDSTMTFTGPVAAVNAALNGLTVTPPANFIGGSTLSIRTNDQGFSGAGGAREDIDTVNINWAAANDPPINTVPGARTIDEDTSLLFATSAGTAIRVSDVDASGANVRLTITAQNGTFTLADTTGLTFTSGDGTADATMAATGSLANLNLALENSFFAPTPGFNGSGQVTVAANDLGNTGGAAQSDTDVIPITIVAINDGPVNTVPGAQTMNEDEVLTFTSALPQNNLIATADADAPSLQVTLSAASGTVSLRATAGLTFQAGDGTNDAAMVFRGTPASINSAMSGMTFQPTAHFFGLASLSINTNDQGATGLGGALLDEDAVDINVLAVNDAPTAVADTFTVAEDSAATTLQVLANDTVLPDLGESLTIVAVSTVANGVASTNGATVTYQPNPNFAGTDAFTYTVSDGVLTTQAQITVTVTSVNDLPDAVDDAVDVNRNAGPTLLPILANDISAPDMGETLRVTDTSTPAHGTLTITNNGTTVRFEPVPGYSGPDAFTYTISDGNGGSDTASVAITVVMGNNAVPVAVADAVSINEDAAPTSIAVLANDTGLTDLPLTVALVSQPASGTAEVQSDNTILYTAPPGYSGVVSFTYSVADVDLQSSSAEVTITISAVDDVPVATADSVTLPEDTAVNVAVLANDPNLGDAPTTLTIQTEPIHGTAVIETDNSITYTPEPNYFGTDTFAYRIADSTQSAQAIVTLIVTAVADAPEAVADVASGRAGQELDIDVMANDISVDGDELTLTITTPPANGTATVESGLVHYAPNPGYTGSDTFLYAVTNTSGLSDEASVVVGVGTDSDSDGIIDVDEVALGTDPAVGDTDGDGVLDGQEVNVTGTDPLDDDSDDDGLTDYNEDPDHDGLIGDGETDPNVFDTDDDGLSDGLEVGLTEPQGDDTDPAEFAADQDPATTTDPTNPDTDGDGYTDGAEDNNRNGRVDANELDPNVDSRVEPQPPPESDGGCGCGANGPSGGHLLGLLFLGALRMVRRSPRRR